MIDNQDPETWPQTTQVFETSPVNFGDHVWIQQGYQIIDSCPGCIPQGVPIPVGQMLIKEKGEYRLVDELTRM